MGATGFHHYRPFTSFLLTPFSKSDLSPKEGAVYIMSMLHNLKCAPVYLNLPSTVCPCFPQPGQSFLPRPRKTHTLLLQSEAEGSPLHLTNPDVQFLMFTTFTSVKGKCEFLEFQRDTSAFNKMLLPPTTEVNPPL